MEKMEEFNQIKAFKVPENRFKNHPMVAEQMAILAYHTQLEPAWYLAAQMLNMTPHVIQERYPLQVLTSNTHQIMIVSIHQQGFPFCKSSLFRPLEE